MATVLLLALMASGLVVEGSTDCPTATEVANELRPLLPEEFAEPEHRLSLSDDKGQITIALTSGSGEVLAKRLLPERGTCASQAQRVAVIAAAWQAQLSDEPLPPAPPLDQAPELRISAREPAPPTPTKYHFRADLGLRFTVSAATHWAPIPDLQFGMGRSWGRWGFLATVAFPYPVLLLGPTFIFLEGSPTIAFRAQGVLSLGTNDGLFLSPGVQLATRVSFAPEGPRAFLEAAYEHYFVPGSNYPAPNQLAFAGGVTFGGP